MSPRRARVRLASQTTRRGMTALARLCTCGLVVVTLSFALPGCEPAPTVPKFNLTEQDWTYGRRTGTQLSTDHFEIYTTIDDRKLLDFLPTFLEMAYQRYSNLVPAPAESKDKLNTYLFATRYEWDRFSRKHYPARYPVYSRIRAGGYAERNNCVVYYLRRLYTLSVVAHEGFHQYLGANFATRIPAWLNEGYACYCETFQIRNDLPLFTPAENAFRANSLRQALAGDSLIPLTELLATDAGKVIVQNQSRLTGAYYAQAWALLCMLHDGADGKYADGLAQIGRDIGNRSLRIKANAAKIAAPNPSATSYGEAIFRAYITTDLEGFEKEYHSYLRKLVAF